MAAPRHNPAGQSAGDGFGSGFGGPRSPRSQALSRALSRRNFLRNAALAGVATPSIGAFLASCSSAGGALPGSTATATGISATALLRGLYPSMSWRNCRPTKKKPKISSR